MGASEFWGFENFRGRYLMLPMATWQITQERVNLKYHETLEKLSVI